MREREKWRIEVSDSVLECEVKGGRKGVYGIYRVCVGGEGERRK